MRVAIIDYGSGNLRSAAKAMARAADESGIAASVTVTSRADEVAGADRIVLPGVGAFADCMAGLMALEGMGEALTHAVIDAGRPFRGSCVGRQWMASRGREHGDHAGLDCIGGSVDPLVPSDPALKVPHMGWNELRLTQAHPVTEGLGAPPRDHAYFVHSYHFVTEGAAHVLATADYGGAINAIVGRDNLVGTQFHPEKSQATGLKLLANFLAWAP